jgi:hypothetical protein
MGRLSTKSNPTSLLEIDKRRIEIVVSLIGQTKHFTLQKFDLNELGLSAANRVVCVARAGKTSQRVELGTVAAIRRDNIALTDLDASEPLKFRILVHETGSPRLLASAENLRPRNETESESLLPMEPADLGQLLWKLDFTTEGPVLKFNSTVFPNAAGVENYLPFASLVLPEAVRRIVQSIAEQPDVLDDETDPLSPWGNWLDSLGIERPNDLDDDGKDEWCNRVIENFCNRHSFSTRLAMELSSGRTIND